MFLFYDPTNLQLTSFNNLITQLKSQIQLLQEKQSSTYKPKNQRNLKVILRNMHCSMDTNAIKKTLLNHGHSVSNIWNFKHRETKNPLYLQQNQNQEIYRVYFTHRQCSNHHMSNGNDPNVPSANSTAVQRPSVEETQNVLSVLGVTLKCGLWKGKTTLLFIKGVNFIKITAKNNYFNYRSSTYCFP